MKYLLLPFVLIFVCYSPLFAQNPETPCWYGEMDIEFAYSGDETLSLFNLPNGNGSSFSNAQLPSGSYADATITITLFDCNGDVVASFPAEDLWLESADGGLLACTGGTNPDEDTDENGVTFWSTPLMAAGTSLDNCVVLVSGSQLSEIQLPLHFNSADMNGDGQVNLADVAAFSGFFFGSYNFSADFFRDGELNISDVGRLAQGLGSSCP